MSTLEGKRLSHHCSLYSEQKYCVMDPEIRAQELIRCDLCETEMVQVHCDTCHVRLCNACIGEHMTSSESLKKHEIVKFIFRKSIPLYPFCTFHDREHCEMYCNQCAIPVCNTCIASDQHSAHKFFKILDILKERKEKIIQDKNELSDSIYPKYEQIVSDIENMMQQLEKECGGLSEAISKHGEEWHREIDKVVTKLRAKVEELKNNHLQNLQRHLDGINEKISKINDEIKSLDVVVDTQDISKLFNIALNAHKHKKLPEKPLLSYPKFSPFTFKSEKLCDLFGTILPGKITYENYSSKKSPRSSATDLTPPVKQLLYEAEIITTINTGYESNLQYVACLSDEEIWTCGYGSTMKLFSINQGSELKSIRTKSGNSPSDIAVTKHGNLVYTDYKDRTVNIEKNEEIEIMITLENWKPCNICSTASGDLLVVMDCDSYDQSKIVRYHGSTEKQTIQFDDEGIPLFSFTGYAKCVSENKNLDICVADYKAKAVVVVNQAGKLKFRYTGPKSQLFQPRGIATDSHSHILVADLSRNDLLHVLDQDGQILCYIDCRLKEPRGMCIDTNDNLFVAQRKTTQVMKIKYLQ